MLRRIYIRLFLILAFISIGVGCGKSEPDVYIKETSNERKTENFPVPGGNNCSAGETTLTYKETSEIILENTQEISVGYEDILKARLSNKYETNKKVEVTWEKILSENSNQEIVVSVTYQVAKGTITIDGASIPYTVKVPIAIGQEKSIPLTCDSTADQSALTCDTSKTVPLKLYWNNDRQDNFTVATEAGIQDANAVGYWEIRVEGHIFSEQLPGTVPLKLYWNNEREDNFTVATEAGIRDANTVGYWEIRVEGYIFPDAQAGTVPLKLFWNGDRGDNITVASEDGERDATFAGYRFVRIEGYICP